MLTALLAQWLLLLAEVPLRIDTFQVLALDLRKQYSMEMSVENKVTRK